MLNKIKIQYAVIAHQELVRAQEQVYVWSNRLEERLAALTQAESDEYNKRVAALIQHLARNGPPPSP